MRTRPPINPPAPPVAERPRCLDCHRPLRPYVYDTWGRVPHPDGTDTVIPGVTAREWKGTYYGVPHNIERPAFCTSTCAVRYAVNAVSENARRRTHCQECGARITRKKDR